MQRSLSQHSQKNVATILREEFRDRPITIRRKIFARVFGYPMSRSHRNTADGRTLTRAENTKLTRNKTRHLQEAFHADL